MGLLSLQREARSARRDRQVADRQQREHFVEQVTFAREHSPFYRHHYRDARDATELRLLPVTSKRMLMERFDDWVTDREIKLDALRAFVEDPHQLGKRFLGKYVIATTSGTTGTRGIFVIDERTLSVAKVIMLRWIRDWLDLGDLVRIAIRGGRVAMVMASGGHFASAVAAARMRATARARKRVGVFPVQMPLPELVSALDAFRPAVLAPFASMAAILATEQEAARLHLSPVAIALAAEGLASDEYTRIAKAFGAKVGNSYAATECMHLSQSCDHGWLHVNTDWVIFEPVDDRHQPVAPGAKSHTVLITNLANRVQPIIRYDLGDSVLERLDPCPCGNPLPAIRVQGRAADGLMFERARGERVSIPPLAFGTALDRIAGIEQFQIVQTEPTRLLVRLSTAEATDAHRTWQEARAAIGELLSSRGLDRATVALADEPPVQDGGGKFRQVILYGEQRMRGAPSTMFAILLSALSACGATGRNSTSPAVDRPAPDFTAKHVDDTPFQLSSLRGRVVVLDIWAAWCDGCEKELPVLDALASRVAPLGATVVSVSVDEEPQKALELLRARKWTMTALYDSSGRVGDAYEPAKMPAVYIIDRGGVIRDVRFSLKPADIAAIEARVGILSKREAAKR